MNRVSCGGDDDNNTSNNIVERPQPDIVHIIKKFLTVHGYIYIYIHYTKYICV